MTRIVTINKRNGYKLRKKSEFLVGDVVRYIDSGSCYTLYDKAFKYFNIPQYNPQNYNKRTHRLSPSSVNKNTNWIVCGIALHGYWDIILYHIKNKFNEHLVVGKEGITLRKQCLDKNCTKQRIFNQIPSIDL